MLADWPNWLEIRLGDKGEGGIWLTRVTSWRTSQALSVHQYLSFWHPAASHYVIWHSMAATKLEGRTKLNICLSCPLVTDPYVGCRMSARIFTKNHRNKTTSNVGSWARFWNIQHFGEDLAAMGWGTKFRIFRNVCPILNQHMGVVTSCLRLKTSLQIARHMLLSTKNCCHMGEDT